MFPNNQPSSMDYLNQIAPQQTKKNPFANKKILIIGGLGALAILIIIIGTIANLTNNSSTSERLAAKLVATQEIVTSAAPKIKTSQLRTFNSNLKLYLTNTIRDITPLLVNEQTDIKKLSSKVTSEESSKPVLDRLEDARLNAVYDRTYAREIAFQLDSMMVLMNQMHKNSRSNSLKTFLEDASKNLAPIQQQFADFNSASE